ncbi:Transcription factor IIA alpha/beta subunit [Penicillium taxi]|uniref:Transcription factor IIA alpha/beta subunit n=1 Tax=Penicillium taxi TaxID=168475 RepID=UPI002545A772|nr:Transcription factor IIA alpha/beta subunit [Penicillium taxi]KAJ5901731.1 Transcription factor IIA alpha/beta subunit [Penicillium taxi]
MSNQLVGPVFEKVIQEVCDSSQVDFEESGVDQKTLLDLREASSSDQCSFAGGEADYEGNQHLVLLYTLPPLPALVGSDRLSTWQKKLSSLNVAQFPWDPPAQISQPPPPQSTVPSNVPRPQQQSQHQYAPSVSGSHSAPIHSAPIHSVQQPMGVPHIKMEPGTGMPLTNTMHHIPPNSHSAHTAHQRAADHIQQKFGAAAAHSVSQIQARAREGQHSYPQYYPPENRIKQDPGHPSQTDGAGDDPLTDWKAEVARRREAAQNGQGDHLLREHLNQQMLGLEAGGLPRPLSEHKSSAPATRRAAAALNPKSTSSAISNAPRIPGQFDGAEEEDEDAINSDLDDPDDLVNENENADESDGQVMLCTYDKVQRVKNKWKCTLKDGILTSNGREYLFHKGQGEFEW